MNFENKLFKVKTDKGNVIMRCLEWTEDRRVFAGTEGEGFLDIDWMEFQDQWGLGRIELLPSVYQYTNGAE